MGIFSGKKRTTIQSVSSRLLDDKRFKYSSKQAVLEWIWDNNQPKKDLTEYLIEGSQNALPKQLDKLYRFALKKERYIFGLPKATVSYNPEDQVINEAKKYINNNYTGEIIDIKLSDVDLFYELCLILKDDKDITHIELFVSAHTKKVYEFIGFNNTTPIPIQLKDSDTDDYAIVTYTTVVKHPKIMSLSKELSDDDFITSDYTHTKPIDLSHLVPKLNEGDIIPKDEQKLYATIKEGDKYHWFSYVYKSGGITKIDNALTTTPKFGEYYPRLYLKLGGDEMVKSNNPTYKKHSKKAFSKLGLDIKAINQELKNSMGEGVYYDMQGLFLFVGVRVNQVLDDSICAEYLYRYFERLYNITQGRSSTQFIDDEKSSQSIEFTGIERQTLPNKLLDKVGTYGIQTAVTITDVFQTTFSHHFSYQQDEHTCLSIIVTGLKSVVKVAGYTGVHQGSDTNLVIPIDKSILKQMTQKEREWVLYKSLHIQMMMVKITKGKWYERGALRAVIAVIGIVITIINAPAGASMMAILKAVLATAIKTLVVNQLVTMGLELAIKQGIISVKQAGYIQFAIVIASMGKGANVDMSKLLTAPNIMKAVNASFDFYNKQIQAKIHDVNKKMMELNQLQKSKQDILAQTQKLLDTKVFTPSQEMLISPILKQDLFETVDMFYHRHNSFNVVALSHGLIEHFVEGTLANKRVNLPTTDELDFLLLV